MKQLTMLMALAVSFCSAQTIEKFSIDNGGASVSAGGLEVVYTIGEVNIQERQGAGLEVSEGFISANTRVLLAAKVFLQGPILNPDTPGLMDDDLRSSGYIPTTSPYGDGLTAAASVFNAGGTSGSGLAQDDIVDWVYVEIRQGNDNSKLVRSQSCLLQRDGDIVDVDGLSSVIFNAAQTTYYIVVKHRNHLGAMSDVAIGLLEATPVSVDFTNNTFGTFGSNAQVQLGSGDMALWTGDTDGSGSARFSGSNNDANVIKDYVLADPGNIFNSVTYASSGYLDIDLDMSGSGRFSGANNDSNIIKDNILAHPGNIFDSPTYVIQGTIPPISN